MAPNKKRRKTDHTVHQKWRILLIDQFFVFLCFAVFFLIGALIAFVSDCDTNHLFYIACGTMHLASAVSAAAFAKRAGKNGILVGLKKTALCILIVLTAGLACSGFQPDFRLLLSAFILIISAALGGIIGVNFKSKPSFARRKGLYK